jgi:GxxExxY protein
MNLEHRGHRGTQRVTGDIYPGLSEAIISCGMKVHSAVGPGLLESVYEECPCHEMSRIGIAFKRQVESPIHYGGFTLGTALRLDLLIEDAVIVEVKAVERIIPLHEVQLLTYMRLAEKRLGLLLNFNVEHFRHGIRRRVL